MGPETEDLRPPLCLPSPRRAALLLGLLCALLGLTGSAGSWASAPPSAPSVEGDWELPTPTGVPEVLRPFSAPPAPWAAGHRGVDLGAGSAGSPIRAPASGTVSFTGAVVDREVLSIDHGAGYVSSFEPVASELEDGEAVSAGEVIASLDSYQDGSPHCEEPCVHWGVRHQGEYINPLLLLGDLEPSVLLPLTSSMGE